MASGQIRIFYVDAIETQGQLVKLNQFSDFQKTLIL